MQHLAIRRGHKTKFGFVGLIGVVCAILVFRPSWLAQWGAWSVDFNPAHYFLLAIVQAVAGLCALIALYVTVSRLDLYPRSPMLWALTVCFFTIVVFRIGQLVSVGEIPPRYSFLAGYSVHAALYAVYCILLRRSYKKEVSRG